MQNIDYGYVHFFNAFRDEIVLDRFNEGLSQLLTKLLPKTKKAMSQFSNLIRHAKLSLNLIGIKIEVGLQPVSKNVVDVIKGLLEDIDQILKKSGKHAVIFFDEFQDIVESDSSDQLQAVLRDFAQFTEHLTFIVSGSHRHMLIKIFDDSNKPFYKLFDRIDLNRIDPDEYRSFIQKLAVKKWGKPLKDEVLTEILHVTECHAYYVNRLCSKLWNSDHALKLDDVAITWAELVEEEFGSIAKDLSALTKNQRIALQTVCKNSYVLAPNSEQFLQQAGMSARSATLALDALERADHIEYIKEKGYRAVDPVAKALLNK